MITPVSLFLSKSNVHKNRIIRNNQLKNNSRTEYKNNNQDLFPKNISFAGIFYQNNTIDFASTIKENYFQLPKIKLKNGELYQLLPDESQIQAAKELYQGNSLLYSVSTGTGKTAVAHWAITRNLNENKKTIFTVPTKALANDKYDEFSKIYGEDKVGILTGDKKLNSTAPIVIMTTEIYDKQVESSAFKSKKIGTVIYDEAHYISDDQRGTAWENSIIESAKKNIQILLLSATIGNCEEYRSWIESLNPERTIKKIELDSNERYVPQLYYSYFGGEFTPLTDGRINLVESLSKRQNRALETIFKSENNKDIDYQITDEDLNLTLNKLQNNVKQNGLNPQDILLSDFKTVLKNNYDCLNNEEIESVTNLLLKPENKIIKTFHNPHEQGDYPKLVLDMKENNMLPAIIYRLSKRKCNDTAKILSDAQSQLDLTTEEEKNEIKKIISQYQKENKYLGLFNEEDRMKLINGIGTHHSSKSPEYKALVEELFRKKLLKVVVATSTLGVGIDMPAKSTVVSDMSYGEINPITQEIERKPVTVNEFYQMIGRAGRRGQDSVGNVIIYNPYNRDNKDESDILNIDEEKLIQKYLISKPNDLNSAFKPSVSSLAHYFTENKTQDNWHNIIKDSFKVYLSKNCDNEILDLTKQFQKCSDLLLREGYIYNVGNETYITPKGKILSLSKSSNPLMLAGLLYDKNLKNISTEQLCQIAGYIAGSEITPDINQTLEFKTLLSNRIKNIQSDIENEKNEKIFDKEFGYEKAKIIFKNKEKSVLKNVDEIGIDFEGKAYSNEFSGYVAYMWAILNQNNSDSIENFNKILTYTSSSEQETAKNTFKSKSTEGNNYKIIAQSVSILKQMNFISNYALEHSDEFPEIDYWQEIKEKTEEALKLMNKPPIEEISEINSSGFEEAKNLPVDICPICNEPMTEENEAQKYALNMLYKQGKEAKDYIQNGIEQHLLYPMTEDSESFELKQNNIAKKALDIIKNSTLKYPGSDVRNIIRLLSQQYSDELKLNQINALEKMLEIVEDEEISDFLKADLYFIINEEIEEIFEKNIDEIKTDKFNYKLKRLLKNKNNLPNLYQKLLNIQNSFNSDSKEIAEFFINLNKQTSDNIASVFANKKTATAVMISKNSDNSLNNYLKVCTSCADERGTLEFLPWIKQKPNYRTSFEKYINSIRANLHANPSEEETLKNYIEYIKSLIG